VLTLLDKYFLNVHVCVTKKYKYGVDITSIQQQ